MFAIALFILIILLSLFLIAIMTLDNKFDCYFFYHKEWILWERVIKNFDNKVFIKCYSDNTTIYNITIAGITYDMYRWSDGHVSLFNGNSCVLSTYDKYHQNKIKKLFEKELSK